MRVSAIKQEIYALDMSCLRCSTILGFSTLCKLGGIVQIVSCDCWSHGILLIDIVGV